MIDVGRRCNYLQTASNEQCRAGSCGDVQKRTRRCGHETNATALSDQAPSDVVSPQHDDRLIVERLSACSKGTER